MCDNAGIVAEELFADLCASSCGDLRGKFTALRELECLQAVLVSRRAELVASVTGDFEQGRVERGGGFFSARQLAA